MLLIIFWRLYCLMSNCLIFLYCMITYLPLLKIPEVFRKNAWGTTIMCRHSLSDTHELNLTRRLPYKLNFPEFASPSKWKFFMVLNQFVISQYCKCSSKERIPVSSVLSQHIFKFAAVDKIRNGTQLENLSDKKLNVLFSLIHEFDFISFSSRYLSTFLRGWGFVCFFFFSWGPLYISLRSSIYVNIFSSFYLVCSKKG